MKHLCSENGLTKTSCEATQNQVRYKTRLWELRRRNHMAPQARQIQEHLQIYFTEMRSKKFIHFLFRGIKNDQIRFNNNLRVHTHTQAHTKT